MIGQEYNTDRMEKLLSKDKKTKVASNKKKQKSTKTITGIRG